MTHRECGKQLRAVLVRPDTPWHSPGESGKSWGSSFANAADSAILDRSGLVAAEEAAEEPIYKSGSKIYRPGLRI